MPHNSEPHYRRHDARIEAFLREHAAGAIAELPGDALALICSLGACLEPFVHLAGPGMPAGSVPGFEGVALGPGGMSFGEIIQRGDEVGAPGDLLRVGMLLAVISTGEALSAEDPEPGAPLLFTANLDEELLATGLVGPATASFNRLGDQLLLEVNEAMSEARIEEIVGLSERHGFGLALDDVDDMDPEVLGRLMPHTRIVKLSSFVSRDILAERDFEALEEGVEGLTGLAQPTVLEGLSRESEHDFLREAWPDSWGPLWAQSHARRDTGRWAERLRPLGELRRRGGFYLPAIS